MKHIFSVLLCWCAVVGVPAQAAPAETRAPAAASPVGGRFLRSEQFDLRAILPAPPAADSLAAAADRATVLQVQAARTPEQVAWAQFIEHDDVFKNARVLGAWFSAENLPVTAEFFAQAGADGHAVTRESKSLFPRKRPPFVDPRVQACVPVSDSGSYPSGHASRAWMWAVLLAEIFPERREALYDRASAVEWGRVIGGVHFPTDTAGGRIMGEAVARALLRNPAVRAELERCRAEAAPFLLRKAA